MGNHKNYKYILGIDISKKRLDCCLTYKNQLLWEGNIPNTKSGLTALFRKLKSLKVAIGDLLFCCENTGIYTLPLLRFVQEHNLNLWLEAPITIKKSLGFVRGKSDQVDAHRIATYAYHFQDKYRPWAPPKKSIETLRSLSKRRKNLLKVEPAATKLRRNKDNGQQNRLQRGLKKLPQHLASHKKDTEQIEKREASGFVCF